MIRASSRRIGVDFGLQGPRVRTRMTFELDNPALTILRLLYEYELTRTHKSYKLPLDYVRTLRGKEGIENHTCSNNR